MIRRIKLSRQGWLNELVEQTQTRKYQPRKVDWMVLWNDSSRDFRVCYTRSTLGFWIFTFENFQSPWSFLGFLSFQPPSIPFLIFKLRTLVMASLVRKRIDVLAYPGTNIVPIPTKRYVEPKYYIVKDALWLGLMNHSLWSPSRAWGGWRPCLLELAWRPSGGWGFHQ